MRIPHTPPDYHRVLSETLAEDTDKWIKLYEMEPVDSEGRWLHWEEVRRRPIPQGFTAEEYWAGIRIARERVSKKTPFQSKTGETFKYAEPDTIREALHWVDSFAKFGIGSTRPVLTDATGKTYLVSSLIEEAFSSSVLEGAVTTRDVAKRMIREDLQPKDESEQMVLNNYRAMLFIRENKHLLLTPQLILDLHAVVTENTIEYPGQLRTKTDQVAVADDYGVVYHIPPDAEELPERLQLICDFANGKEEGNFLHPVIKAIILHFMIGYDHPFTDGNGRTARALWYWFMAKSQYELMEFVSISAVLKEAPHKYARAYLYTETDGFDLTYFIIHQLDVVREAVKRLDEYIARKAEEIGELEDILEDTRFAGVFNHRQLSLLQHAVKNPGFIYRIGEHQVAHKIAYQTARTDLIKLAEMGLLRTRRAGKTINFVAPPDLIRKLREAGSA